MEVLYIAHHCYGQRGKNGVWCISPTIVGCTSPTIAQYTESNILRAISFHDMPSDVPWAPAVVEAPSEERPDGNEDAPARHHEPAPCHKYHTLHVLWPCRPGPPPRARSDPPSARSRIPSRCPHETQDRSLRERSLQRCGSAPGVYTSSQGPPERKRGASASRWNATCTCRRVWLPWVSDSGSLKFTCRYVWVTGSK
jgi:hypothetical protein